MLSISKDEKKTENAACCAAHETGRKVREFVDHAAHDARDAAATAEKQIRANPFAASAIAAGIGFLFGALFRRR